MLNAARTARRIVMIRKSFDGLTIKVHWFLRGYFRFKYTIFEILNTKNPRKPLGFIP